MMHTFFKDLKIVELASVLAGPSVGLFFAELGASVTKIENRTTGGDVTRKWRLPSEDKSQPYSAYYSSVNWGKEVLLLDLKNADDIEKVYDLVREADVVISNLKLASAEKLGVDQARLQALNSKLVFAQLTGFGASDERPAFDVVLQAEAGFLYMNGEPNRPPAKMPVALIDLLAAHQLKEGILLALLHRASTGEGSYVRTSLLEAALASLANQATNWLMEGHIPQRMGTTHPNIAPYGDIFYTKDEKAVILAVGTEQQFVRLCQLLGVDDLAIQPEFATNTARVEHREALSEQLRVRIVTYNCSDLLSACHAASVPIGSVRNMKEVFELPQAQEMLLQETRDGQKMTSVRTVAFQWKPHS